MRKVEFDVPKQLGKNRVNLQVLAKGFGLPLVKRVILGAVNNFDVSEDKPDGISTFGTPLYGTLFIKTPSYYVYEYNPLSKKFEKTLVVAQNEDLQGNDTGILLSGVIIEANQTKNIVTTEVSGASGTVKEYINEGDLLITVRGFISSPLPDVYPRGRVETLQRYLQAPVALNLANSYINNFGVNGKSAVNFVVTNWNMFQQEGTRNIQFFEFSAMSDAENEIIIKDA